MLLFVSNKTFKKLNHDQEYHLNVVSLDLERARHFVGYDLGPNFLLMLRSHIHGSPRRFHY